MTSRQAYLESHSSLGASMDDFEPPRDDFSPTVPDYPSQHSGFRSHGGGGSEYSEHSSSRRSTSPPAWRRAGSGWFRPHVLSQASREAGAGSREGSPQFYHDALDEEDGDVTAYRMATRLPLPGSPMKGRSPSHTPEPERMRDAGDVDRGGGERAQTEEVELGDAETPTQSNYFRFSTRLDVVQKTQPIEDTVNTIRKAVHHFKQSRWHTLFYAMGLLFAWSLGVKLLSTPETGPVPDLIKVAGLAKSFEPAIYYSEHGHEQITELQETGIAVWDLGESVRYTNMTSAPTIVNQLDELSDSIKTIALEMTRFFAGVDGDVDAILYVMEWAQLELASLISKPPSTISSVWSNAHSLLSSMGLMSQGRLAQSLLGMTHQQLTRATLERVFNEYLSTLEEAINRELTYGERLFEFFGAIDQQFLNLQRSVIREQDTQERLENDFLSSLWTKVIGVNASKLRKYEKNKDLLASVRDRTVRNKHVLGDHNQRLRSLQEGLEVLRRKLVSPLVRSRNSSTLSVEEQIRGLKGTYQQLRETREVQKRKMMSAVYKAGDRRHGVPGNMIGEAA
ncbi:hypothetical protein B0A55_08321 [Friedmanniomyces simplex]|uniref:Uncharacterized protein n=1 Tax=Friedmanniomyces simplex TaxID=329884 RepID=A0A4U0X7U5_9PEZI|nr:hypothetical protein B0A55_08321 [Friedmanniomyces simplex]